MYLTRITGKGYAIAQKVHVIDPLGKSKKKSSL